MSDLKSRRTFVKGLAASSMAPILVNLSPQAGAGQPPAREKASPTQRSIIEPFNYEGVQLSQGMLQKQFRETRNFYFSIPNDDILKGFRQRAGMRAPGNDLGGWYSGDPTVTYWWSKGDTFNVFGQWLSGMARLSKAVGDEELRNKAIHLMIEWGKTVEDDGYFFYSRHPNSPHYIYDKMVCGLVDVYQYCDRKDALELLEKITDWAITNLDRIRKPNVGGSEWYTLSENLYRAYLLTGNPKYKSFGDVWLYPAYWNFFTGDSASTPYRYHAYSHVNTLSGAAMAYEVTGDAYYLEVITKAYEWFERTQFYATGGYGPEEEVLPPDGSLSTSLENSFRSFETICGSWAAFKLGRYLMQFTGEARYGDWIENLVYNGIGAALPMSGNGQTFYYSDYRMGGARKIYHLDGTWPCCSGTFPQVVADYYNVIYFRDGNGLYVNLFAPSTVTWQQKESEVSLVQESDYPECESSTLTLNSSHPVEFDLRIRIPRWADRFSLYVNKEKQTITAKPGQWASIRREWKSGDRVEVKLPMFIRLIPIDVQHPTRVAVTYGPVVLVQKAEPKLSGDTKNLLGRLSAPLSFSVRTQLTGDFVPFYQIGANVPYNMYFDIVS
jgi:DUF1680 family protein